MREGAVKQLRALGWEVIVITPNYGSKITVEEEGLIRTPLKHIQELSLFWERIGVYEDYLDPWVDSTLATLKEKVTDEDIAFASTGSDLATIKLASLLKREKGCKLVVNYRDPIQFAKYRELTFNPGIHINRDKMEEKYIRDADLILTSSASFLSVMKEKYPDLAARIFNNYFGYLSRQENLPIKKSISDKLKIVYAGRMGTLQKPEILAHAANYSQNKDRLEIIYIGDFKKYKKRLDFANISLIDYMEHARLREFLVNEVDVGFVSLAAEYLSFCLPSKIYEYINLGLPVLAALPDGDAANIVTKNGYGLSLNFEDFRGLADAIDEFFKPGRLEGFRNNIIRDRDDWAMEKRIKEVDTLLRNLSKT